MFTVEARVSLCWSWRKLRQVTSQDSRVHWTTRNLVGDTPLMYYIKNNQVEKAKALLNSPMVDVNTVNKDGKCPENIVRENQMDILDLLFRGGSLRERIPECPVGSSMVEVHVSRRARPRFGQGDASRRSRREEFSRGV